MATLTKTESGQSASAAPHSGASRSKLRPWQKRRSLPHTLSQHRDSPGDSEDTLSGQNTMPAATIAAAPRTRWWRIKYFQGILGDIKRRAPFYWSDWKDAWDYRVVPATVYMYFAK